MTLRDLTPAQIKKLQKECASVYKTKQIEKLELVKKQIFELGFSEGLKAGLATLPK